MIKSFKHLNKEVKIAIYVLMASISILSLIYFLSSSVDGKKEADAQNDQTKAKSVAEASSSADLPEKIWGSLYQGSAYKFRFHPKDKESAVYAFEQKIVSIIELELLSALAEAEANRQASIGKKAKTPDLKKKIESAVGKKTKQDILSRGELHLKFFQGPDEYDDKVTLKTWHVAALLVDYDYLVNGKKTSNSEALAQPFAFRMKELGEIDSFQFMRGTPQNAQLILKAAIYSMQVNFSLEGQNNWLMRETNGSEYYDARYAVRSLDTITKEAILIKKKEKYLPIVALAAVGKSSIPLLGGSSKVIRQSEAVVQISFAGSWFGQYQGKESEAVHTANGREWASAEATIKANKLNKRATDFFPDSFAEFLRLLASSKYFALKYYETDPFFDMLGRNLKPDDALALFRKLAADKGQMMADRFMINYLRQHPDMASKFINMMDADSKVLSEKEQLNLYHLIAKAGHKQAQEALISAFSNPDRRDITRIRGVANAHAVEYPQPELIDKLWETHNNADLSNQTGQDLKAMSLYAIGSLGNKEKENEVVREKTANQLSSYLNSHKGDSMATMHTLDAIGNHGGAQLIPNIQPLLTSRDSGLRINALRSMRRMDDPMAAQIVRDQFEMEENPSIRAVAAEVLAEMPADRDTNEWALAQIQMAQRTPAKVALAKLLGERVKEYPENADVLRKVASSNVHLDVKKMIYRYVTP